MTGPRKLTVLHLVANRWWTGSADPVVRLLTALGARGHRVLLGLISGDRFEVKAREAGIEPLRDLSLDGRFHPVAALRDVRRLRALIRTEAVDVIHVHHSHDHWLGRLSHGDVPLVRTFHNLRAVRRDRLSAWLYRGTDALIAVSRQIEDRCRAVGIAPASLHRVSGVVDTERFAAPVDGAAMRRALGLGDAPAVGCVSRLAANRGHELLISAFQLLRRQWPEARLVLVGKGEARRRIEDLVARLDLRDHVVFAGYRDADLPAVLGALDVFVLMGAGSDESCRAALEAMAAGRPVVARAVGALPETVVHGETGVLLNSDSPEAVAEAIGGLLASRGVAQAMGAAGRRWAIERSSPERHAADTEAIYGQALARGRIGAGVRQRE
jgi:L-malate glycosyltransferase